MIWVAHNIVDEFHTIGKRMGDHAQRITEEAKPEPEEILL